MGGRVCTASGSDEEGTWLCDRRLRGRGFCQTHLKQFNKGGPLLRIGRFRGHDLKGSVFGRLTVVERSDSVRYKSSVPARWLCRCVCGNEIIAPAAGLKCGDWVSCGCSRGGRIQGRTKCRQGYAYIHVPGHPRATRTGGRVLEHIVVMEEKEGRPLRPGENVHHINGVKDDNRPENLQLWSTSQPAGQRIEDKTAWAKEWLALYEPEALNLN